MFGKYLPIVYYISLSDNCPHAISYLCLPSEDNQNTHQFNAITIDTAGRLNDKKSKSKLTTVCIENFKEIRSQIDHGFEKFTRLFDDKLSLNQIKDKCLVDLQGDYDICANYSLGIVLNYLFQQDHLASNVLDFCDSLSNKGTVYIKKILVTIGNVSKLFHQFLRYTIFEHIQNNQLFQTINGDSRNDKADENAKSITKDIINLLINPINSKKTLWAISKFLKECNKVIREWSLDYLEKDVYDDKQEEQRLLEQISDTIDEYNKIKIRLKRD